MKLFDGCPECARRDNPARSVAIDGTTVTATYRCAPCRLRWTTRWHISVLDLEEQDAA